MGGVSSGKQSTGCTWIKEDVLRERHAQLCTCRHGNGMAGERRACHGKCMALPAVPTKQAERRRPGHCTMGYRSRPALAVQVANRGQQGRLPTYWDSEGGLSSSHKTPARGNGGKGGGGWGNNRKGVGDEVDRTESRQRPDNNCRGTQVTNMDTNDSCSSPGVNSPQSVHETRQPHRGQDAGWQGSP